MHRAQHRIPQIKIKGLDSKFLNLSKNIELRIPRQWRTFYEDAIAELKEVTNTLYEGNVVRGLKNGQGKIIYPNGDVFKGSYKNDERSGQGLCKFACNGSIYKGEWRDDKPFGSGTFFSLPCEVIEARFDGFHVIDGQIKVLFTNGEFYEGHVKNSQRNGQGQHNYKNGDSYEGEWQNDCRIGRGRMFFQNGAKLSGMFIDDKADGYVEFEDNYGNIFQTENEEAKAMVVKAKTMKRKKTVLGDKFQYDRDKEEFVPGSFTKCRLYQ